MNANMRLTVEHKVTEGGNFDDSPPEQWDMYTHEAFHGVEWFKVEPLSGREYEEAQRMQSAVTHNAECHYFQGANSRMRLRDAASGRIFNVQSVVNRGELNRTLDWRLVEVTNG